jgi:hypothetical protein
MTQTGSVASSSPAVDAGSQRSPAVTGRLYPTRPSRPAATSRPAGRGRSRPKTGQAHGSSTSDAAASRISSSGSGDRWVTAARVATGASPHRHTATKPAASASRRMAPPGRRSAPAEPPAASLL